MKTFHLSFTVLDKLRRTPAAVSVLVSIATVAIILSLRSQGFLQFLDMAAYDLHVRLIRSAETVDVPVVLIRVTEKDIEELGHWPLSDAELVQVVDRLQEADARVIGIDIYRDIPVPPGTEALGHKLANDDRIIAIKKLGTVSSPGVRAPPILVGTNRVGFSDVVVDPGGVVRRGLLFADDGDAVSFGFALRMALRYLQDEGIHPQPGVPDSSWLRLGPTTLPVFEASHGPYVRADAGGYQILMDYKGGSAPFESLTLMELLGRTVAADRFKGKIALVGVAAESVKDHFYTPYDVGIGYRQGVAGIVIHAHLVSQLLRAALAGDKHLKSFGERPTMAWIIFWGALGCTFGLWVRSFARLAVIGLGGVLLLVVISLMAFANGWWIPFIPAGLAWLSCAGLVTAYMSGYERRQREMLMQIFGRYVSADVANEIWRHREEFTEAGRLCSKKLTTTVLFTDIEHFTSVSEKLDPPTLLNWLNIYMEAMVSTVIEYGGVIDDYYGDAIKANFGVPVPRSSHAGIKEDAVHAVRCALAMGNELRKVNDTCKDHGLPKLRMRVGICTGTVVAGCLGSPKRLKYTTIGDTVNIAARLESFEKAAFEETGNESVCRTLIAESTFEYIKDEFTVEPVGKLLLKGKGDRVSVFRVLKENRAQAF